MCSCFELQAKLAAFVMREHFYLKEQLTDCHRVYVCMVIQAEVLGRHLKKKKMSKMSLVLSVQAKN
jgi:hypothetical protein